MSNVTRAAGSNVAALFNTVGTAAIAATTAISVIGDAASVLSIKSNAWLLEAKLREAAQSVNRESFIVDEVALEMAQRLHDMHTKLAKNDVLKESYVLQRPAVQAAIDKAMGRSSAT